MTKLKTLDDLQAYPGELFPDEIWRLSNESDDPDYLDCLADNAGFVAGNATEWIRHECQPPFIPDENAGLLKAMLDAQRCTRMEEMLRRAADMHRTGFTLPIIPRLESLPGQRYLFRT